MINNLLDKILFLVPEAKVSVTNLDNAHQCCSPNDIGYIRDNLYILWNSTNTQSCPTQQDLDQLNIDDVKASSLSRRKDQRDIASATNSTIMAQYKTVRLIKPSLTLREYLDEVYPIDE